MGQFLLRDGSGSLSTPHQQHIQGVGEDALTGAIFYTYFSQMDSHGVSGTRSSSNIKVPSRSTAQICFQNQLSATADLPPFLEVQHLLKSCPHFTDGEIESQRWDPTELRLQTCASLHPPTFDKLLFCPDSKNHK